MYSPKVSYLKNLKKGKRAEFETLFYNIYILGQKDPDASFSISEGDAVKKFIPGRIYTFHYDPLYKDVLDWYDTFPVVMANNTFRAGTGNYILSGINFNFLPEKVRVATLEKFYRMFKSDIEKTEQRPGSIISRIIAFFQEWYYVLSAFNGGAGVGYQFAYRNYIISRIKNLRLVEYRHWELVPFINPKSIVGASVDEIYKTYWKKQIELNKKKPNKK